MNGLDQQMQQWSTRLRDDLRITPADSSRLASAIASEVKSLSDDTRRRVKEASVIPLETRIEELKAFQAWMDLIHVATPHPVVVRAQVITQNYICFVYLGEACFNALRKELPSGSTAKRCCKFLTDNPVRAFRNAIAHSNWRYLPDFSGLEYWAREGEDRSAPLKRFVVLENELSFWQAIARCTAYSAFLSL